MGGKSSGKNKKDSGGTSTSPDNSGQIAEMQRQQAMQAQNFARMQAEAAAAAEAKRKAEEQAAKDRAIAEESARARGMATSNQNEVAGQLQTALAKPMEQSGTQQPIPYSATGSNATQPVKAIPGSAAVESSAPMTSALIAQKINQDSGGTNQQQNRFNTPRIEGLVFGGT